MSLFAGVLLLYVLLFILAVGGLLQYTRWRRMQAFRSRAGGPPRGFTRTHEVNIDPTTGVRERVWYNEKTGERWYEPLD